MAATKHRMSAWSLKKKININERHLKLYKRTHVNTQDKICREKSLDLSLFLKVDREGAEVTLGGRLFQARAAAIEIARSPTVESLVRGTSSAAVDVDRSLRRESAYATQ